MLKAWLTLILSSVTSLSETERVDHSDSPPKNAHNRYRPHMRASCRYDGDDHRRQFEHERLNRRRAERTQAQFSQPIGHVRVAVESSSARVRARVYERLTSIRRRRESPPSALLVREREGEGGGGGGGGERGFKYIKSSSCSMLC